VNGGGPDALALIAGAIRAVEFCEGFGVEDVAKLGLTVAAPDAALHEIDIGEVDAG